MSESAEQPVRRGPQQFEVVVSSVIREASDAVTIELFPGTHPVDYRAGQFLTIDPHQFRAIEGMARYLEAQKGKRELVRAYSLSSAPHEKRLAFTVKEERYEAEVTPYPPLLSPLLVHNLGPGAVLEVTGFTGAYVLTSEAAASAQTILHVVAGSGSVPNFGILKGDLEAGSHLRHVFVYSNKTHLDVIFRTQLDALAREFPERLKMVHLLTRDPQAARHGPDYRHARLTLELLRELVPEPAATLAFACGPGITLPQRKAALAKGEKPAPRFLESALAMLAELGIPKKQVHHESYG